MAQEPVRIFLSYTRKDQAHVERLYQHLREAGFTPWMDTKDLLPGQKFEYHIKKAIRQADFFLACLSPNSVNRRGVIQREIQEALDVLQEKLDSDIFLIPVRLEDCDVPERLREFHWANLYEDQGLAKLLQAIRAGIAAPPETVTAEDAGQVKSIPTPAEDHQSKTFAPKRQQQQQDLEAEYDLLSEKIKRLRRARIIETDVAVKFKLDQQITEAELEREDLEQQLSRLAQAERSQQPLEVSSAALELTSDSGESENITDSKFQFETIAVDAKGKIVKRIKGDAQQQIIALGQGVNLEMVYIPGGTFLMGSPENEEKRYKSESPQHQVTVAPFYMGKYPVTQAQWEAVMGKNPSHFKGANRPVEQVLWDDAQEFLQNLNDVGAGSNPPLQFRLPSEAEWEYVCRAGTTTPFYFGETITTDLANYDGNSTYAAGPNGIYRKQTTDVGSFPPNAFGLYDMHGNVWEWCVDPWHENYAGAPTDGSVWETGGDALPRLLRGGSWHVNPPLVRCAYRNWNEPDYRSDVVGLRVVVACARTL